MDLILPKGFNPVKTAESGQCFRWKVLSDDIVSLVAFGEYATISPKEGGYVLHTDSDSNQSKWEDYFDFETDYEAIEDEVFSSGDAHVIECYAKGKGIRILKQELFETIVSFLISQNNNIPRIKNSIELICQKAQVKAKGSNSEFAFPSPWDMDADSFFTKDLGLGYRDVYLRDFYRFVKDNPKWLDTLSVMDYQSAKAELLKLKGIGPKVAECVLLFALHHIDAFPIDTHIKQLINKYYPEGFDRTHFEGFSGIIQQYLFYYEIG